MPSKTKVRGHITYDSYFGHVCTCALLEDESERDQIAVYAATVFVDRTIEATDTGSWYYRCDRCGAGAWSGL